MCKGTLRFLLHFVDAKQPKGQLSRFCFACFIWAESAVRSQMESNVNYRFFTGERVVVVVATVKSAWQ